MSQTSAARTTAPDIEERTRDRVLGAVLEHGPVSAAGLGELLGFTPAAVRRHLGALTGEGLIEVKLVSNSASGAGRPARRYVVSPQGQAHLGNDYLSIARAALEQLARVGGSEAVEDFTRHRYQQMEDRLRPVVDAAGEDLPARTEALAAALNREGYVASSQQVPARVMLPMPTSSRPRAAQTKLPSAKASPAIPSTGTLASIQLCQGHCPVRELAAEYPILCDAETEVFSRLLGVDVRRLSTLAGGGHVCTTHIPVGRAKSNMRSEPRRSGTIATAPAPGETVRVPGGAALKTPASHHQQERP